jgi:hypothetical protein
LQVPARTPTARGTASRRRSSGSAVLEGSTLDFHPGTTLVANSAAVTLTGHFAGGGHAQINSGTAPGTGYDQLNVRGTNNLGTVFRITTNGVFTSLVLFHGTNGSNPSASLTLGQDGNLYGTTLAGGTSCFICGTVFKLTNRHGTWTETLLHSFS